MKTRYPNVYKDKDGHFFYHIFLGIDPVKGKPTQQKRKKGKNGEPFKSAKEAYLAAIEAKHDFEISAGRADCDLTISDFIRLEYRPYYKASVQDGTYNSHSNAIEYVADRLGNIKLVDLNTRECEHFRLWLLKNDDLSTNYSGLVYGVLRQILDYAVTLNYVEENVSKKTGSIPKKKVDIPYWTLNQFERVISTIYVDDYYEHMCFVMIWLYYMTGIRVGEGLALRWKDVDFENKKLKIYQTLKMVNRNNFVVQDHTKTKSGMRTIALDDETINCLKDWKKVQRSHGDNDFILTCTGSPQHRSTVKRIIEKYAKAAKVPVIQPKGLRHSHVSYLINVVHANITLISNRLGHSSPDITLKYYAHMFPKADDVIAKEMNGTIKYSKAKESKLKGFNGNQFFKRA
ncbi:tyrosine-type recombinase/integrase [Companilactobacillus sp. HBUAS59699]|uniref:tyrosine-type recombinase/integrase n=1 Tax=Companilactobacillus sp. HBUAS59699 TaxID=3109358 RepID=UPI002FEEB835